MPTPGGHTGEREDRLACGGDPDPVGVVQSQGRTRPVRGVGPGSQRGRHLGGGHRVRCGGGHLGEGAPGGPLGHHQAPRTLRHHIQHGRYRWCVDPEKPQRAPRHPLRILHPTSVRGAARPPWNRQHRHVRGGVDDRQGHVTLGHGVLGMPEPLQPRPTMLGQQPVPAPDHRSAGHQQRLHAHRTSRKGQITHDGRPDDDPLRLPGWPAPTATPSPLPSCPCAVQNIGKHRPPRPRAGTECVALPDSAASCAAGVSIGG